MTSEPKIRIYLNTSAKMSRGKAAAHAVHAALTAFDIHPGHPVVVLGAKPQDIEQMRTVIRDAGRTELEPGTLTAGTDYSPFVRDDCEREDRTFHEEPGEWTCDHGCGVIDRDSPITAPIDPYERVRRILDNTRGHPVEEQAAEIVERLGL
ncbi:MULTISPECIES: hypothetical protein [Microbacterium]|uniref:hypothetical protein n=1 Tax=Microbacterium TaxID=33882 RepID=UPI00034E2CE6|nr:MULTISPECIES: hypothetical protein [Microbacterium]EPD84175.1 hypothetical protein HMPREF1529_02215 [Microbacterium sp. oral taxon 186 str. F0373]